MPEINAKLYLIMDGETEYLAIVTDNEYRDELKQCYKIVEVKGLDGDFTNWPTNRLMGQE